MFSTVDHIAFAVRDVEEAIAFYSKMFDVTEWERIPMPDRHQIAASAHIGGFMLELIAPTSDEAAFAKYLRERGPGMHHVAYRVENIETALAEVKARGVQLIDEVARPGLHNHLVAFLHPKSTMGVLIELVQYQQ